MSHKRVGLLAAMLVTAGVAVPATGTAPAVAAPRAAPVERTVTLPTGDNVAFGGRDGVRVLPAKGREDLPFYTQRDVRGHTHVIPADVLTAVSTGKLDARQFDVSALAGAVDQEPVQRRAVDPDAETYDVTLKFIDHDGKPAADYAYRFVDVAEPVQYGDPPDPSGTAVVRLPKGEYYFDAIVQTDPVGPDPRTTQAAEPSFVVDGPRTFVVDARAGKPVGFRVDQPNATAGWGISRTSLETVWGEIGLGAFLSNFDGYYLLPSTTTKKGRFTYSLDARMAEPNGTGFAGSPYLYNLRETVDGQVPSTLEWRYRDTDLAHVRAEHAVATPGMIGVRESFLDLELPAVLNEYYTPNTEWEATYFEKPAPDAMPGFNSEVVVPRMFSKGRTVTERWNTGVFGPAFPLDGYDAGWYAARLGDELGFNLPLATDQAPGRAGWPAGTGETTLLRDGVVVAETPWPGNGVFAVPADPGQYTLRTTATQPTRLSTTISAEWTFTSAHSEAKTALPLLAVRFAPYLDDHNATPAGRRFVFPMYVQRNGAAKPGNVNDPTVQASYDDGKTWQAARVTRKDDHWQVAVNHPPTAKFVSLRSSSTDQEGNTASQTIVRAYALR